MLQVAASGNYLANMVIVSFLLNQLTDGPQKQYLTIAQSTISNYLSLRSTNILSYGHYNNR